MFDSSAKKVFCPANQDERDHSAIPAVHALRRQDVDLVAGGIEEVEGDARRLRIGREATCDRCADGTRGLGGRNGGAREREQKGDQGGDGDAIQGFHLRRLGQSHSCPCSGRRCCRAGRAGR